MISVRCLKYYCATNEEITLKLYRLIIDVNECLLSPCDANADCNNTDGSFDCECRLGFLGDGFQCTGTCNAMCNAMPCN